MVKHLVLQSEWNNGLKPRPITNRRDVVFYNFQTIIPDFFVHVYIGFSYWSDIAFFEFQYFLLARL